MTNKFWQKYLEGEIDAPGLCRELEKREAMLTAIWDLVKSYDTRPNVSSKVLEVLESAD